MRTKAEKTYDRSRTRRQPTQQDLDIFRAWQLGTPGSDLARKFGIDKSTVSRLVRRVQAWRNNSELDEVEALRESTIAELTHLASEAIQGWERSKQPTVRTRTGTSGDSKIDERTETTSPGDPRFLEAATKIIDARSRVAGLGGQPLSLSMAMTTINVGALPEEIRDELRGTAKKLRDAQVATVTEGE